MPKHGRRRKKSRTHVIENEAVQSAIKTKADELKIPKSLIIRRGRTATEVSELVTDLRYMMMPYTALHFEENPKNRKLTLMQYSTHLALPMGITHIMSLSQNDERLNIMIARTPEGPTLSFRIHRFSLNRHIKALQKRPINAQAPSMTTNPPVVVTNNFGDHTADPHIKLMRITFQNLFPQINVSTVKLNECRRVVLFNLLTEEEQDDEGKIIQKQVVHIRQYAVKATPTGVNRRVRRLVQAKLPNLHKCKDIADYLQGNAIQSDAASDSEPEDDPSNIVKLSDQYAGKGNNKAQTSALKLIEMGPRLSMELIKVQKGLGVGDILYHSYIHKTPEEDAAIKRKIKEQKTLKDKRRAVQETNVQRKRQIQEEKIAKKKNKRSKTGDDDDDDNTYASSNNGNTNHSNDDNNNSDNEDQSRGSDEGQW